MLQELVLLKWFHILAMVYWLGGEWGVFQTSYNVVNRKLPLDERRRHMETAYRIDILARSGIILLLPIGLHMGAIWKMSPFDGGWLVLFWSIGIAWLALCWAAFLQRETTQGMRRQLGVTLTKIDENFRFILIPLLMFAAISSMLGHGPFNPNAHWFSTKVLIYSLLLVIGLKLRFIMREWTMLFRQLAEQPDPMVEAVLEKSIRVGRRLAYVYWIGISTVCLIGAAKAF